MNEGAANNTAGEDFMEVENLNAACDNKLRYNIVGCTHLRGHARHSS